LPKRRPGALCAGAFLCEIAGLKEVPMSSAALATRADRLATRQVERAARQLAAKATTTQQHIPGFAAAHRSRMASITTYQGPAADVDTIRFPPELPALSVRMYPIALHSPEQPAGRHGFGYDTDEENESAAIRAQAAAARDHGPLELYGVRHRSPSGVETTSHAWSTAGAITALFPDMATRERRGHAKVPQPKGTALQVVRYGVLAR
jgi:hypothetical protein